MGGEAKGCEAALAVDGMSFVAGGRTILDNISFDLGPGRMLGLIGHNGSGKTTLARLMARQLAPTSGAIHIEGRAAEGLGNRDFARKVAFLQQYLPPATGMTVRELVCVGRYAWHGALGRFSAEDHRKVEDALELTDTERFADRFVDRLSGGERQRVWLAMMLAQNPRVLLLDEPTAALDIGYQLEILSLVRRLAVEHGLAVVAIMHDVNMAARFSTDILALRAGRLVTHGAPDDILTEEALMRIYGVPMHIVPHPGGHGRIGVPQ